MSEVFVVTNGHQYLDWDDKGAMSTGYPHWTDLVNARKFTTRAAAEKSAEGAWRCDKDGQFWTQKVSLVLGNLTEYIPVELDPEWAEYNRLKSKFNNR